MAASSSLLVTVVAAVPLLSLLLLSCFIKKKPLPPRGSDDGLRRQQLPPSPAGLPLVGHLHLLGRLPHRSLRSLAALHGPVMLLRLGRVPTVVVSSAVAAEEAMKTRDLAFAGRPRLLMAERLLYGCRDVGFAPYGEYWRQVRRVCAVHLLGPRRVYSFRHAREVEVAALIRRVRAAAEDGVVNLSDALICYSKNVISRAAFGDEYGLDDGDDGGERLRRVFADFEELIAAAPVQEMIAPWLWWVDTWTGLEAKTTRTFQALDGFLDRVIADHRSRRRDDDGVVRKDDDDHRDLVDVLLDVNEMDKESGFRLDTDNIKGIIMDIFAAGTDTSYTVLGWAMAELINHPDKMRKLQQEIRGSAATSNGRVTEDHLDGMVYLKAVISETMRLHVPAPFLIPRETVDDTELQGYHIPAGTRVMINAWAIGRDPAAWGDKTAEEFVPERWFATDDESAAAAVEYSKTVGQDFRFLPFGAGRRGCPGAGFAAPTIELALANMLYHFDWEPATTTVQQQSLDMSEEYGLSLRLKAPLLLVAKPWFADQCH